MVFGNPFSLFVAILVVIVLFEYDFFTKEHLRCDVGGERNEYAELYCMAKPENLHPKSDEAYLKNYGRWQFYIVGQILIVTFMCKTCVKIGELKTKASSTIGARYILTIKILVSIIGFYCGTVFVVWCSSWALAGFAGDTEFPQFSTEDGNLFAEIRIWIFQKVCWILTFFSMGGYFNVFIVRTLRHVITRDGSTSPLEDIFPTNAQCIVRPTPFRITFATCDLPLNHRAPYYFLTLFFFYIAGLSWVGEQIFKLALEKISETRACMEAKRLRIETISKEVNVREERDAQRKTRWDELLTKISLRLKNWTKPRATSSSASRIPLISETV